MISVDTKKKEIVGNFKNAGKEWRPEGEPAQTLTHDFEDKELGKAVPYGVYDPADNSGWVSVGVDHDTAEFATDTILMWWKQMGRKTYPDASELLVMAYGGGSNGSRSRLWKLCLQRLANTLSMKITVCHFPPGTSKWNKIEHRMFSFITQNWRGKPLISLETIVKLIGSTSTRTGLLLKAKINNAHYETGIKVMIAKWRMLISSAIFFTVIGIIQYYLKVNRIVHVICAQHLSDIIPWIRINIFFSFHME